MANLWIKLFSKSRCLQSRRLSETQLDNGMCSAVDSGWSRPVRALGGFNAAGGVTLRWSSVLFSEEQSSFTVLQDTDPEYALICNLYNVYRIKSAETFKHFFLVCFCFYGQAVQVFVCRVQPLDKEVEWTDEVHTPVGGSHQWLEKFFQDCPKCNYFSKTIITLKKTNQGGYATCRSDIVVVVVFFLQRNETRNKPCL